MKEKGFTLIELLAVIVILSVITLITVPMITNVIEESKKKTFASSVEGLVESANLYAIENDGVYEFLFDKEHKGSTKKGESLEYKGNIDGEGKLYLDKEGNVSICISNDTYYVYKNYNSGIIVGERKAGNCIIGFDALTNKYVAMLDNGTGNVSNVYSKDEVNNLVDNLDTKITNNTNEITNMKSNIEELQSNLNNYALKSELEKTNTNVENLSSLVSSNQSNITNLQADVTNMKESIKTDYKVVNLVSTGKEQEILTYHIPQCKWYILSARAVYNYSAVSYVKIADANGLSLAYMDNSTYPTAVYMDFYGNRDIKVYAKWVNATSQTNEVTVRLAYAL